VFSGRRGVRFEAGEAGVAEPVAGFGLGVPFVGVVAAASVVFDVSGDVVDDGHG